MKKVFGFSCTKRGLERSLGRKYSWTREGEILYEEEKRVVARYCGYSRILINDNLTFFIKKINTENKNNCMIIQNKKGFSFEAASSIIYALLWSVAISCTIFCRPSKKYYPLPLKNHECYSS